MSLRRLGLSLLDLHVYRTRQGTLRIEGYPRSVFLLQKDLDRVCCYCGRQLCKDDVIKIICRGHRYAHLSCFEATYIGSDEDENEEEQHEREILEENQKAH